MKTKNLIVKNDGTFYFYILKYLKQIAETTGTEDFVNWYVKNIIFPYCHNREFLESIWNAVGKKIQKTQST